MNARSGQGHQLMSTAPLASIPAVEAHSALSIATGTADSGAYPNATNDVTDTPDKRDAHGNKAADTAVTDYSAGAPVHPHQTSSAIPPANTLLSARPASSVLATPPLPVSPADTALPGETVTIVASITQLMTRLSAYLSPAELKSVREAYRFADEMHLGQMRKSGEPYISHPIAVAEICAEWKLDAQAIMAAFLHDVIEDQDVKKEELIERFGAPVASLVDGLSKLDKIEFQSQIEAQAENFRKMLLAMARDVRVILVKLADRLHNMRTLEAMAPAKVHRIARETMEVYVPIAHRLGLNNIYRELQDLSFSHLHGLRHRTLLKALKSARGNRREVVTRIMQSVADKLLNGGVPVQVEGREKSAYAIYHKMRTKSLSFSQVLDIFGFRILVDTFTNCYVALGLLHSLYKPMPGKFKDYIAIPKMNGYQSLHTTVIGPYGAPIEFQIRTQDMHEVAEAGVAAHWLYKDNDGHLSDLQQRTHLWLQSLLDIQKQTGDSAEFLEHVKIDLFPDSVYVFTPKSRIIALPRGATALDFAYSIHTELGDQTIATKINHEPVPLRTELHNGDIVEIISSAGSRPSPNWLNFVRTGKARSAIRHYLRTINHAESIELGERLLSQALAALQLPTLLAPDVCEKFVTESGATDMAQIHADIGIGKRMAGLVARHIATIMAPDTASAAFRSGHLGEPGKPEPVVIYGNEGITVQFASCCQPLPGDKIVGQLRRDQGLMIHTEDCHAARRLMDKEANRWIDALWSLERVRRFNTRIKVLMNSERGLLARVAAEIGNCDANITHVNMDENVQDDMMYLSVTIDVEDRVHLARVMRNVRRIKGVDRILRDRQ